MREVIDLTTMAAEIPLPPLDHPFWNGPVKSAGDITPVEMTPLQMALEIRTINIRLKRLEQWMTSQFHIMNPTDGKNTDGQPSNRE